MHDLQNNETKPNCKQNKKETYRKDQETKKNRRKIAERRTKEKSLK